MFLAIAAATLLDRPKWWWLAALAPLIAFGVSLAPIGRFQIPVAALAACLVSPRCAAVALLLAIPEYEGLFDAVRATVLWMTGTLIMDGLARHFEEEDLPGRFRGAPVRLLACGVLYYALSPLSYL